MQGLPTREPDMKPDFSRLPTILLAVAVAFVIGAVVTGLSLPATEAGDVLSSETALSPASGASYPGSDISPSTSEPAAESAPESIPPNEVSLLEQLGSQPERSPVRLRIQAIGVDASVAEHGVDRRTGQMDVPRNVNDVAWYKHGPAPGERGSAVLAAHVDLSSQGPGVFYNLRDLAPGDRVAVSYDDGSESWFVVEARTTYDKDELPLSTIFSRSGSPTLTLITCGGGFNASAQEYDSNVVVYAIPLEQFPTPTPETA